MPEITESNLAVRLETLGFELTLWLWMMQTSGYGLTGPDALTDEPSTVVAEGRGLVLEWDTPVTLHYARSDS